MDGLGHYAKNIAMLVGQAFAQRVLGMVSTVILARTLGATNFGTYSVVMTTSSSAFSFVRLGVDAAIHVCTAEGFATDEARRKIKELLAAGLIFLATAGTIGAIVCISLAGPLAEAIYDEPALADWIRVAGIAVFLFSLWQFCYSTLAGLHRFAECALVMVGVAVLNFAAISLGALGFGLAGAVSGLISVQAISVFWLGKVMLSALRRELLWFAFRNVFSSARSLLKLGLPIYLAGLVSIPVIYYLQGMVVRGGGLEQLGYLRVIFAIVSIVSFAPMSAAAAMTSMFAQTRTEQEGALADRIVQNVRLILVFALLLAAGITVILPWFVPFVFGSQYLSAIGPASVALLTAVLTSVATVVHTALLSARKMVFLFLMMLLQAVMFLSSGIALIPIYGLAGYLAAELLSYIAALAFVLLATLPWLRLNGVRFRWLFSASLPYLILVAYVVRRVAWADTPKVLEGLVGGVVLGMLCVWVLFALLSRAERRQLVAGIHLVWSFFSSRISAISRRQV